MMEYRDFWALIDCNNFYVSCQQVFEPKYVGRPCVVLSNNDGCVVSRSDEAKAMGIQMGEPYHLNIDKYKAFGVKVWSSNYSLYGDMSRRVMGIITSDLPEIQVYSIDECFGKLYSFENQIDPAFNMRVFLLKLREKIYKWTGIPVCIGVGPTKALSKVANRVAKKHKSQTGGVHIISNDKLRIKALNWMPVEDVWGIGRRHAARLHNINIRTAYQFSQLPDDWVRDNMSVVGLRLLHDLRGNITIDFEKEQPNKNIACMRSFDKTLYAFSDVSERLTGNVAIAAAKLRNQKDHCRSVSIYLSTGAFTENPYSRSPSMRMEFPSNSTLEINACAQYLLKAVFKNGPGYKKCGVVLSDFRPASGEQLQIFGGRNVKHDAIMAVIDKMNFKYSGKIVKLAMEPATKFQMRQDFMSPRWTTIFDEMLTVRV